jgi:hypothetical protein
MSAPSELTQRKAVAEAPSVSSLTGIEEEAPAMHAKAPWKTNTFSVAVLLFQAALIILYGTCTRYGEALDNQSADTNTSGGFAAKYAMFQDTHM